MLRLSPVLAAGLALAAPQDPETTVVDAGPLRMEIHISRTAHRFHVVDQISGWSRDCHAQYRALFADEQGALPDADLGPLRIHGAIRADHGWGQGLEQAFYVTGDLDAAVRRAVASGVLTEAEAEKERTVLLHFAPRIDRLLEQERPRLQALRTRLVASRDDLRAFAERISRFCNGAEVTVPVFLLANPADHDFGGGYNGDRLTVEVPRVDDVMPTVLHELMHAFVHTQKARLVAAAASEPSLDFECLDEGIAYALAPGLHHAAGETDTLRRTVADDLRRGLPFEGLVRFRRYGLALRPLLRETLDDAQGKIDAFLPRAVDAWRALAEVEAARGD